MQHVLLQLLIPAVSKLELPLCTCVSLVIIWECNPVSFKIVVIDWVSTSNVMQWMKILGNYFKFILAWPTYQIWPITNIPDVRRCQSISYNFMDTFSDHAQSQEPVHSGDEGEIWTLGSQNDEILGTSGRDHYSSRRAAEYSHRPGSNGACPTLNSIYNCYKRPLEILRYSALIICCK